MARTKSEFLKSFGTAFEVFKAITDEVTNRGGTDDDLRRVLSDSSLRKQVAELIVNGQAVSTATKIAAALSNPYTVPVNYGRKLKTAVKVGKYDWNNDYYDGQDWSDWKTPDDDPLEVPKGRAAVEKELLLFHIGAYFGDDKLHDTKEVLAAVAKLGLKAEAVPELLTFGEKNPDVQREFPVIALGSVWVDPHGDRRVAGLWSDADERCLSLHWFGYQWNPYYRILVSRAWQSVPRSLGTVAL